jgi:hypothetical protein
MSATNKPILRTAEEFANEYQPVYSAIYPAFLSGPHSKVYERVEGSQKVKGVEAIGDMLAKKFSSKDTLIHQLHGKATEFTFDKNFYLAEYKTGVNQSSEGDPQLVNEFLDNNNVLLDQLLLFGDEGNQGLYTNNSSKYVTETPIASIDPANKNALFEAIMATADEADKLAGSKILMLYGENTRKLWRAGLFQTGVASVRENLMSALGSEYMPMVMPSQVTPNAEGWMIINLNKIKVHNHGAPWMEPGEDAPRRLRYVHFLLGSVGVELMQEGAIIKQAVTAYEAEGE